MNAAFALVADEDDDEGAFVPLDLDAFRAAKAALAEYGDKDVAFVMFVLTSATTPLLCLIVGTETSGIKEDVRIRGEV